MQGRQPALPNGTPDGKRGTVEEYLQWQEGKELADATTIMAMFAVPKRTAYNWRAKYKMESEGD